MRITSWLSCFRVMMRIVISPIVSYNPNLMAFSTSGCSKRRRHHKVECFLRSFNFCFQAMTESNLFDIEIQLQMFKLFLKCDQLLIVLFYRSSEKIRQVVVSFYELPPVWSPPRR